MSTHGLEVGTVHSLEEGRGLDTAAGSERWQLRMDRLGVPACIRQEVPQCCCALRPEDDHRLKIVLGQGSDDFPTPPTGRDDMQDRIGWVPPHRHHPAHPRHRGSHELAQCTQLGTDRQVTADTRTREDLPVFRLNSRTHVRHPEPLPNQLRVQGFGRTLDQSGVRQPASDVGVTVVLKLGHAASLPCIAGHKARTDGRDQAVRLSRGPQPEECAKYRPGR